MLLVAGLLSSLHRSLDILLLDTTHLAVNVYNLVATLSSYGCLKINHFKPCINLHARHPAHKLAAMRYHSENDGPFPRPHDKIHRPFPYEQLPHVRCYWFP